MQNLQQTQRFYWGERGRGYFIKEFYQYTDIWVYMKLTNMKISPNSPLAQSSFSLSSQGGLTVDTKLIGVISATLEHYASAFHFK